MRNLKENFGVILYKNIHLNAYGKLAIILLVISTIMVLTSLYIPNSAFYALPVSILSVAFLIIQLVKSYKEQVNTAFNKILISPQAKKIYNNVNEDITNNFAVIVLPSKSKVSFSESLNKELLSNKKITFNTEEKFETVLLNNWRGNRNNLGKYLVFKSQQPGHLFNEKKVALLSSLTDSKDSVDIGKTSYFSSLITNEAAGKSLINEASDNTINFNKMLPIKNGKLLDIPSSKLSNHIGITLLGLTKDNHLVFWTQNSNAQVSVNSLVATGSGSLDWHDVYKSGANDLLGIVKYGMARELVEESSLDKKLISKLCSDDIIITGFFRWIERGGKPEFVGICNIPVSTTMFHPNTKEVDNNLKGEVTEHPLINTMSELSIVCKDLLMNDKLKIGTSLEYLLYQLHEISSNKNTEVYKGVKSFWNLK